MCLHDGQVVRHEQIGHAQSPLKVHQEIEDLRANGDVERRDGLVADDQRGLQRQGPRDDDALALPAGELVRVAARMLRPQAHRQQQFADAAFELLAACDVPHRERFTHRLADRHARIERECRILENHLRVAADVVELIAGRADDLRALDSDAAARGADEADDGVGERGFSAARIRPRAPASRRRSR